MAVTINRSSLPFGPQPLPSQKVASFRRTESEEGPNISPSEHRQLIDLTRYWQKNRLFETLSPREASQEMALLNEMENQQDIATRLLLAAEGNRNGNATAVGTVQWEAVGPFAALAVALGILTLVFSDEIQNLFSCAPSKERAEEDAPRQYPEEEGLKPLGAE